MNEFLRNAEEALEALGHTIQWEVAGRLMAHGRCTTCGASAVLEKSRDNRYARRGPAFQGSCRGHHK